MKKLAVLIMLFISASLSAQTEVTNKRDVIYLLNQIKSLNFQDMGQNESVGQVGIVKETLVFWIKTVGENSITYVQMIVNTKLGMGAESHTIITDLNGENASGTHEIRLQYKKMN